MDWTNSRPLRSGPGRALAAEMSDSPPDTAYSLAVGALDLLKDMSAPAPHDSREVVDALLASYLRGLAAAAIVADAANEVRRWSGPQEFAVGAREVEFLRPDTVLLGTLMLALAAVGNAIDLLPAWASHDAAPRVPDDQLGVLTQMQWALATAAQARMTQVSERAEEVSGF